MTTISFLEEGQLNDIARAIFNCSEGKDRALAIRLCSYTTRRGLHFESSARIPLLSACVNRCSIHHTCGPFGGLEYQRQLSWNSLLISYVKRGDLEDALALYHDVQKDRSVLLTGKTFVALLKACAKLHDIRTGLLLHVHIAGSGLLGGDQFVGSSLVDMYAKSGMLAQAQQAFGRLLQRNVISWTALIAGYAEHGFGLEALYCFEQMQLEGIHPNAITFVCTLKACCAIGSMHNGLAKGANIHAEAERRGMLESEITVGAALVNMYSKLGLLARAQVVFLRLPMRSVATWNALMMGHVEHGDGENALELYDGMQDEGVSPNIVTYVCILKVCGIIGAIKKGQEMHAEVERLGLLDRDLVIGNVLLDMYVKCGLHGFAKQIFYKLPTRDVVSWTTLIAGYIDCEYNQNAIDLFEIMQSEGPSPDSTTYICCLKACGSMKNMEKGQEVHIEIERHLMDIDASIGNSLVEMYSKCGCFTLAWEVFDRLDVRDDSSWSALVAGYNEHGLHEEVLRCFDQMHLHGISPNAVTYVHLLKACGSISDVYKGQKFHMAVDRQGLLEKNLIIGSALVDMYINCGRLAKAQIVFDKLTVKNIISWTTLISGYVEGGQGDEALKCFEQMQKDGYYPDAATFVCALKACTSIGAFDQGEEMHVEIERRNFMQNFRVGNTLIDMYVKSGCMYRARDIFNKLSRRDVISWTTLMMGYTLSGLSEEVFATFNEMIGQGINPNPITFIAVLNACCLRGLFHKSQTYFSAISEEYGIAPSFEHQACIANLLRHVGELDKGFSIFGRNLSTKVFDMV
ncbi:hypothetical protein KP509_39G022100 [Ceratopteris richardii]|uniref:Pentatricopeptide repeat-containing protein n=1 Tax=Ceratopteris richardii TaxID=49495 RepID=A0A8T2PYS3_CERRI|nr:hypothetical protein KP509_39G022100 [Ceratopteris richardii]